MESMDRTDALNKFVEILIPINVGAVDLLCMDPIGKWLVYRKASDYHNKHTAFMMFEIYQDEFWSVYNNRSYVRRKISKGSGVPKTGRDELLVYADMVVEYLKEKDYETVEGLRFMAEVHAVWARTCSQRFMEEYIGKKSVNEDDIRKALKRLMDFNAALS